jgi:hypothetical protein
MNELFKPGWARTEDICLNCGKQVRHHWGFDKAGNFVPDAEKCTHCKRITLFEETAKVKVPAGYRVGRIY